MKRQASLLIASALLLSAPAFAQTATVSGGTGAEVSVGTTGAGVSAGTSVDATTGTGAVMSGTAGADVAATMAAPEGYVAVPDVAAITAEQMQGIEVKGPEGDTIGEIADVELGADGRASGLIADVGGFLGMGEHRVKLSFDQVAVFSNADGELIAMSDLTEEQLKAMPEYEAPKT